MQRIKQIPHEENQYINIRVVDTSQVQWKIQETNMFLTTFGPAHAMVMRKQSRWLDVMKTFLAQVKMIVDSIDGELYVARMEGICDLESLNYYCYVSTVIFNFRKISWLEPGYLEYITKI